MPDPRRQLTGKRSRASGQIFERYITMACDYYWRKGCAVISKTPEPMKVVKPYGERFTGQFVAYFEKQAQPDYKGALSDGTCIIFDAKHTEKDRIQQDAVTETQWETFDMYEEMNAHCYVIVSIALESFYRVPWKIWKQMKDLFGHKYMAAGKELEPYKIPDQNSIILFLEGVELK
ncbi:MAG: Holliday junction resolvase RecU [Lachnospiraceae bacterium]|nr:Holliday junction resolvase RecU [Lachnospiraceae bacterium]